MSREAKAGVGALSPREGSTLDPDRRTFINAREGRRLVVAVKATCRCRISHCLRREDSISGSYRVGAGSM
ncbi:hypothetical protein ACFYX5_36905 [Streptomyces rubiginosohelvolus]|uniref:hypothetical protein n=1 Tax=Streptomyces rubiginosohelvolus TaxID=67362 RepID=UPI0036988FFB